MKNKIVEIDNELDAKKFEKNIWIYKSIFYRNTKFILKNKTNIEGYNEAIEALNIKSRIKRINYIYDKSCEIIDNYNKKNSIDCEFENGHCIVHRNTKYINGCCRLCRYQSEKGCKSKNLTCKLFF